MNNDNNTEIIKESYCPLCDGIHPHRYVYDWHYDGWQNESYYCKSCNNVNSGFSSKLNYQSEEAKRKRREYARNYRKKQLAKKMETIQNIEEKN